MYEINQEVMDWLLEDNNPSVKYLTMINLLELNANSNEVDNVRTSIMSYKPIVEIFQNQKENSYWYNNTKEANYKKYLGTFWQLHFLRALHTQMNNKIANAIEHIFAIGQASNGGFTITGTNRGTAVCLTANTFRSLVHFGYLDDDRTNNALNYLLTKIVDEKAEKICSKAIFGLRTSCYMTIPKVLFAFTAIPENKRNNRINQAITICVNIILENQVFKYIPDNNNEWKKHFAERKLRGKQIFEEKTKYLKKHPIKNTITKAGWTKFGFPLSYNSDALNAMLSLYSARIDYSSEMNDALELIKNKSKNGKWLNEKEFKSPMFTEIELKNKESKWLTLYALLVLKHFEGLKIIK